MNVLLISNWYHWRIQALKQIVRSGHKPIGIVIHPTKKQYRLLSRLICMVLTRSSKGLSLAAKFYPPDVLEQIKLSRYTHKLRVPLYKVSDINENTFLTHIQQQKPDVIVTLAWPKKFNSDLLALPSLGCINCHPSILPAYRGLYPISAAILANEKETGITFHVMTEEYDTGDILLQKTLPITPVETGLTLMDKCGKIATDSLTELLDGLSSGSLHPLPQNNSRASKAPKLTQEDTIINWSLSAKEIEQQARALWPWFERRTAHANKSIIFRKCRVVENNSSTTPGQVLESSSNHLVVSAAKDALRIDEPRISGFNKKKSKFYLAKQIKPGEILGEI